MQDDGLEPTVCRSITAAQPCRATTLLADALDTGFKQVLVPVFDTLTKTHHDTKFNSDDYVPRVLLVLLTTHRMRSTPLPHHHASFPVCLSTPPHLSRLCQRQPKMHIRLQFLLSKSLTPSAQCRLLPRRAHSNPNLQTSLGPFVTPPWLEALHLRVCLGMSSVDADSCLVELPSRCKES